MATTFADIDLPVGSIVVTLLAVAVSLSAYVLSSVNGDAAYEERYHQGGERTNKSTPLKACVDELAKARHLLERQAPARGGLVWEIGRLVIDARTAGWLAFGVCLKVLMGAPAPLQVLALSDAARAMARGGDEGYQQFVTGIGRCFLLFCVEKLLQFLARITMLRGEFLFTQRLQRMVYGKMLQQDYEFFDGKPTAALQNLVHVSTEKVCTSLIFMRVRIIQALATVFFQVVILAWRFPSLALVVNMSLPIAMALKYASKGYMERTGAQLKARGNIVGQRTWDVLSNLPTVRSHCRERGAVEDYGRCMAQQARVITHLHMVEGVSQPFLHFCDMICAYVGYYYGGILIRSGSLTTAELMTVIRQFQNVAWELGQMLDTIAHSMLDTDHARDILDLLLKRPKIEPELDAHEHIGHKVPINGGARRGVSKLENTEVDFREVTFSYPSALARDIEGQSRVLRGLTFVARDGEFTALVGKTGCGKSTVTLLLQRLYDVTGGELLVGGLDVRRQDVHRLRRSIAVVCQEPVLFSTSIYENLLYALAEEDAAAHPSELEERMADACKRADAWEFVQQLRDGLQTDVGPKGSQLSGGQKQRLTIARAILKDAPLLVLDEATSSLDVEAEQAVQRALDQLISAGAAGGRRVTRLVIAHRLSTIRRADKIVAIEGGVVREQGTHEELMDKEGGLYARFLRLSTGEDAEGGFVEGAERVPSSSSHTRGALPSFPMAGTPTPGCCQAANGHTLLSGPDELRRAYEQLRQQFAALRAELRPAGGKAEALVEEVERCQLRLGGLVMGSQDEAMAGATPS